MTDPSSNTTASQRKKARQAGSLAASRAIAGRDDPPGEPVDVFGAVEDARLWLMFQPLGNLFGCYARHDQTAGVLLHSGHPLSLQRFTAAHELGHHLMRHDSSADGERQLHSGRADVPLHELEAQAFAADFLMPPQLVNRALKRLTLPRPAEPMTPLDIYQLALEMGSSYTATVTQLARTGHISPRSAPTLRKEKVIELKRVLADGERPESSRADVWSLDPTSLARHLALRLKDELHIRLPEIPTSGYRWDVQMAGSESGLEVVADFYDPAPLPAERRIGGQRQRHLWLRAIRPGSAVVSMALRRPWEDDVRAGLQSAEVQIEVREPRAGLEGTGVSARQRQVPPELVAA